jgi:hypothetical protein
VGARSFQITELATQPDGRHRRNVLLFDNARSRFEWESCGVILILWGLRIPGGRAAGVERT